MKWRLILGLAMLTAGAGVVALVGRRPAAPVPAVQPAFAVQVLKPRMARPLFGLLPESVERSLEAGFPTLTETSPGARILGAGPQGLDLRADGWDLHLVADPQGRVMEGSYLVFPMKVGGRSRVLRARFTSRDQGGLQVRAGPGGLEGRFALKLGPCEDAVTGRRLTWPPAPTTILGRFEGVR